MLFGCSVMVLVIVNWVFCVVLGFSCMLILFMFEVLFIMEIMLLLLLLMLV